MTKDGWLTQVLSTYLCMHACSGSCLVFPFLLLHKSQTKVQVEAAGLSYLRAFFHLSLGSSLCCSSSAETQKPRSGPSPFGLPRERGGGVPTRPGHSAMVSPGVPGDLEVKRWTCSGRAVLTTEPVVRSHHWTCSASS